MPQAIPFCLQPDFPLFSMDCAFSPPLRAALAQSLLYIARVQQNAHLPKPLA